ncbi:hypothetical protein PSI23_16095 [Xenorhabdus sp. XENO-10]|uniref:Uncharacterized protein n=1 Tax=Xenorhabdus yunnanensis TaxID=3025878 RepID=A0ABT5LIC9_9GAMM|nr:hypothetical protein [Xenorhabdus yunnanensis]MDC9590765.1 hypothetical protein [Xenorhabdus yunnanensis]
MIKDWLKNRLTPEKQKSKLWCEFTDSLQIVLEKTVEPLLERISSRKSIFTMHHEDLDKRIAELGKFFIIRTENEKSKPVLLSQRLDEIHFKGTERPISSTFWREFKNLPAKWVPLWAPIDQTRFPYGALFLPQDLVDAAQSKYGKFFLTSRGVIQLSLNTLYEQYGYKEQAKLFRKLTEQFDQVIAPLIPLEIVFNGFHFYFYFTITEEAELLILKQISVLVDAKFKIQEAASKLSGSIRQLKLPNQVISAIIRPLKQTICHFDEMPLDAWALDLHQTPPIIPIPFGSQSDPRFNIVDNKIWISTEGHYGCLVSLKGEGIKRYSFPSWAKKAFLPIPTEKITLIEKITYCVMPEFLLYEVQLEERNDTVRLKHTTEQVCISAIPEKSGTVERVRFNAKLSSNMADIPFKARPRLKMGEIRLFYAVQLDDHSDITRLKHTTKQVSVSAIPEKIDMVERMRFNAELLSSMEPIEFKAQITHLKMDEVPLDMWALDVNVLAPPVFMGDPRLSTTAVIAL